MKFLSFPFTRSQRVRLLPLLTGLWLIANDDAARAATIGTGDVTGSLGPTFFVDDAVIGGGDITITQSMPVSYNRSFAGLLNTNQGLSRVTLTGFGFASSPNSAADNSATSLTVAFTYLGADEVAGGGDDVVMGSASGTYVYSGAAGSEYVFAFDTPITANLNITGTRFKIEVIPANNTGDGKVRFKTAALTYETGIGPKFSVAGIVAPQRVNLAKYQSVITDSVNGQRLASYLTDGVVGNDHRWQSNNVGPHWGQVVFPFPVTVGSAQVFSGLDDGSLQTNLKLQYLDNSTWVDVPGAAVSNNTSVEHNWLFTTPITASSFRIYSTNSALRVKELALYPPNGGSVYPIGTDLTLNLAYQLPAVATGNTAGNFALLAVDGRANKDSKWQTSLLGSNSLEIDLRVSTKICSAHLYSGSPGVAPLADFVLRYWNGAAWQDIPGGTMAGNASPALAIPFTSGVTTTKVRLEFTNPGITSVRELCIFPANTGNTGYPIGTGVIGAPRSPAKFDDYNDTFYNLTNLTAGRFIAASNGVPGLSQSGLTTAQGQYQVLLNVGTGTYRLRNRATGHCLSGARLATTPGAPLIDAPYSALPDQDWILDPFDSTNFLLINQWSGLVIDTQGGGAAAGTPLVQNVNTGAASQRWQLVSSAKFPKKGVGGTGFATAFVINWTYNWGQKNPSPLPAGAVYNPMQWGDFNWSIGSSAGPNWQYYSAWRATSDPLHLMGFNEPDAYEQSGASLDNFPATKEDFSPTRSMNEAVLLWPRLQAMDLPLVSPAPANMDNGWLASFYTNASSLGYRVDYTALHSYPGPGNGSADGLINTLQSGYNNWNRPVWLTEFSFVNWNGTGTWTEEDNYNSLAEFLWRAESLTWLRKYALFVFSEGGSDPSPAPAQPWSTVGPRSNSYDINGNLTPFGKLYAAWDNDATVRTDKPYHIHNKGTRKRLANTLSSAPGGRSIRIDDSSVKWTLVATGTSNRYYITSARDGRRLSSDGTSVSQVAAGTTGTAVQWSLTENQHGWFYLGHPATSKRLQLAYDNSDGTATYSMVANNNTEAASQWRFIVPPPPPSWSGAASSGWTTGGNWIPGVVPAPGDAVSFDSSSTANLDTLLSQDFNLLGVNVTSPSGPVSIGGTHSLTVGADGIDLAGASQNLTITAPVILGAAQSWSVASSRSLTLNGGVSGSHDITVAGGGKVSVGGPLTHAGNTTINPEGTLETSASNVMPNGAGTGNLALNGKLDLKGTSQSINGLSGSGVIDNTGVAAGVLTAGNSDATGTFGGTLQNTGGTLALVKTGGGNLTLTGNNTHSGGTIHSGAGGIYPKTDTAFGIGPVVMNAGTLYAIGGAYTFANALTLNGGLLRVGGGVGRSVNWSGPVSVTADSGLSADGSTAGITLSGGLDMNSSGHTLTSYASGTANTISAPISGASGTIMVTFGTLNLNAANSFGGTFRSSVGGPLKIGDALAMQNATLDMNSADAGTVNLNNLNATLGALTGSRNLALTSGTISIGNNHLSTTYSGGLSGSGSLVKIGNGTLTLSGANNYSGATRVNGGTLALGASNVLPATPVSIGDATVDAATFTDTVGTLDVTGTTAKIHLGTGAALAFANSSAIDWTDGTLNITGPFIPGVSLRFGIDAIGLTFTQLGLISAPGFTSFSLTNQGYLTAVVAGSYDSWKIQITTGQDGRTQDADGDGFTNLQEFLFGAVPIAPNGTLVTTTASNGSLVLRWLQLASGASYTLKQSATLAAGSWIPVTPTPILDPDQSGAPASYNYHTATLPTGSDLLFFRIEGVEN